LWVSRENWKKGVERGAPAAKVVLYRAGEPITEERRGNIHRKGEVPI